MAAARPVGEGGGATVRLPRAMVSPLRCQPAVPLRTQTTGFLIPALISDCAPMMPRVRPAQFTTMVVSSRSIEVEHAMHQLGAGQSMPPGRL